MSFLISVGTWFIKIATSDLVVSITKKLIEILVQYITDVIPLVLDEIKKVANDPNLKSEQLLSYSELTFQNDKGLPDSVLVV